MIIDGGTRTHARTHARTLARILLDYQVGTICHTVVQCSVFASLISVQFIILGTQRGLQLGK